MRVEFYADNAEPFTPIGVANALIDHTTHYEPSKIASLIFSSGEYKTFNTDDLEQIAEHLLVYCKHNKEVDSD